MQRTIPLPTDSSEFMICRIVHQDEHRLVRHCPCAEAEQVIVAGILPTLTQRHRPQQEAAERRQRSPNRWQEKLMFTDGLEFHQVEVIEGSLTTRGSMDGRPGSLWLLFGPI